MAITQVRFGLLVSSPTEIDLNRNSAGHGGRGKQTGLLSGRIGAVECGTRHLSVKALRKLASRLGVSVHWLEIGREDPAEGLALRVFDREPHTSPLADLALDVLREHDVDTRPPTHRGDVDDRLDR
jgi:hypothetical protein